MSKYIHIYNFFLLLLSKHLLISFMKKFTIQALINKYWLDIAELKLLDPQKGSASPCELEYQIDDAISYLDKRDEYACSLSLPIQLIIKHQSSAWFGFLDDIIPSGAARRYWINYLNLHKNWRHGVTPICLLKR